MLITWCLFYRQNKQMRNYRANWNNCGTMQRKFTKASSQEGFRVGLTKLKEDTEYLIYSCYKLCLVFSGSFVHHFS